MKIVNCLFAAELAGLEQTFVDYSEALQARGHELLNFVVPRAKVIEPLVELRSPYWEVANFNQYDILAIMRIRRRLISERPDVVIAHGNRAINLVMPAVKRVAPFIAVNQHINLRRTVGADFAIAVNENMRSRLIEAGQPADRVYKFFNMVRRPAAPRPLPR